MNTSLKNVEFALITGASNGIGMELAGLMARRGHNLILVARRADKLQTVSKALAAEHGVTVHTLALDLSVPGAGQRVYDHCPRRTPRPAA